MKIIKPYKIVEKGKETHFRWNQQEMTFRSKYGEINVLRDIKKDFHWLELEIKECFNKEYQRMFGRNKND